MRKKTKAFTLIEMLIVLAVIIILLTAVLTVFNPNKRIKQAQDTRRWQDVTSILKAANSYAVDHKAPFCANLGMDLTDDDQWRCLGPGIGDCPGGICDPPAGVTVAVCKIMPPNTDKCDNGTTYCKKPTDLTLGDECCCTSLYDWERNRNRDLTVSTGDNSIEVAQIEGQWTVADTDDSPDVGTYIHIFDWITDETHYIKIYTVGQARHNGKWTNTAYRIDADEYVGIKVSQNYVKIEGLQINVNDVDWQWSYGIWTDLTPGYGYEFSNNIIKAIDPTVGSPEWIGIITKSVNSKIWNNIIYNFDINTSVGISILDTSSNVYINNNTIVDTKNGIGLGAGATNINIRNNLISNSNNPYPSSSFKDCYNNATDHSTDQPVCSGVKLGNRTDVDFIFQDAINYDYHLAASDTGAKDFGVDLSSEFSDDIDGGVRPLVDGSSFGAGTVWDIGADEYGTGACCDLGTDLVDGGYLAKMPEDPVEGDLAGLGNAGYYIKRALSGEIWVSAPHKSEFYDQNKDIMVTE